MSTVKKKNIHVVIFRKGKHIDRPVFTMKGIPLDIVDRFNYIGVTFSDNGSYTKPSKITQTKAQKAFF